MEDHPENSMKENLQSRQLAKDQAEWVVTMREKLKEARVYAAGRPWEKWCIYQVPRRLKDAQDSRAYVPQTLSIGPYHHGNEQVQSLDQHKWIALHQILERTGQDLDLYIDAIRNIEEKARGCYQQQFVHLSSNNFVEMMVLDGCFTIELFRCSPKAKGRSNQVADSVIFNQKLIDYILLDMVMLENQIPLFILDCLLEVIRKGSNLEEWQLQKATNLVLNLFSPEWLTGAALSMTELNGLKSSLQQKECLHILDVFRRSLLYPKPQQKSMNRHQFWSRVRDKLVPGCLREWLRANRSPNVTLRYGQVVHRVTELMKGGVKIKKRNTSCFWDIKFKNGVLEIPPIRIQDGTLSILLNLAAFEHCHLDIRDALIASYAVFMECLIKSPEDVCILHRRGIIQHLLGHDTEVVDLFKSVSKDMLVDAYSGDYGKLAEELNAYYNQRRNRWRASLVQKYFSNPWAIISFVAAVILLLLTATQAFYAVYSYHRPNSTTNGRKLL